MKNKKCVLYDRDCIDCGECDICDLDPSKICDNCGKCIDSGSDYNTVDVDLIKNSTEPQNYVDSFEDKSAETDGHDENDEYDGDSLGSDFGEFFQ